MAEKLGVVASATVEPCRILALSTSTNFTVAHAGANARPFGVSQVGSKFAPTPGAATAAAETGDPVAYHDEGEICPVEFGGNVTVGAELESDSVGRAVVVPATAGVRNVVGIALEAGASGVRGKVKLRIYTKTNP